MVPYLIMGGGDEWSGVGMVSYLIMNNENGWLGVDSEWISGNRWQPHLITGG